MGLKVERINEDIIKLNRIREWLKVMKDEPEGYIKLSEVYLSIRKMIEDE